RWAISVGRRWQKGGHEQRRNLERSRAPPRSSFQTNVNYYDRFYWVSAETSVPVMAVTRTAAPLTGLLPRPGARSGSIVADAPGDGPGYWAGGPSAVWVDGTIWLAYRLRR